MNDLSKGKFKPYEEDFIKNVKLAVDKFVRNEERIEKYKLLKKSNVYSELEHSIIKIPANLKQTKVILAIVDFFNKEKEDKDLKMEFMINELSHIMTTGDSSVPLDISSEGFVVLRRYLKGIKNHLEKNDN